MNLLYFDGMTVLDGANSLYGTMYLCIKVGDEYLMETMGKGTINVAEWSALLWCLMEARSAGLTHVDVVGDSQLAINQANGLWRIRKPALRPFKEEFDRLRACFAHLTVRYQRRLSNQAAVHLEEALAQSVFVRRPWPPVAGRTAVPPSPPLPDAVMGIS